MEVLHLNVFKLKRMRYVNMVMPCLGSLCCLHFYHSVELGASPAVWRKVQVKDGMILSYLLGEMLWIFLLPRYIYSYYHIHIVDLLLLSSISATTITRSSTYYPSLLCKVQFIW